MSTMWNRQNIAVYKFRERNKSKTFLILVRSFIRLSYYEKTYTMHWNPPYNQPPSHDQPVYATEVQPSQTISFPYKLLDPFTSLLRRTSTFRHWAYHQSTPKN